MLQHCLCTVPSLILELILEYSFGYPSGIKEYKLYDITKNTFFFFFVSRDVLFFEDLFPYQTHKGDTTNASHGFLNYFVLLCPIFDTSKASSSSRSGVLLFGSPSDMQHILESEDFIAIQP